METVLKLLVFCLCVVPTNSALAQPADRAEIINDRLSLKKAESDVYVFSIGEIQNNTDATLDDIVLEARYLDAHGALIDAIVERLYATEVPPSERVAFRLQSLALAELSDYASQQIRVISVNENRPCPQASGSAPKASSGLLKQLLISSFPILLLIVVWIYFMRKFGGKNSPQNRSFDLIDRQNQIVEKQSSAIERIANAIESGRSGKPT